MNILEGLKKHSSNQDHHYLDLAPRFATKLQKMPGLHLKSTRIFKCIKPKACWVSLMMRISKGTILPVVIFRFCAAWELLGWRYILITKVMLKNPTHSNDSTQTESHWLKKRLLSTWINSSLRIICPPAHWQWVISFSVYVPGCRETMWCSFIFHNQVPVRQITAVT